MVGLDVILKVFSNLNDSMKKKKNFSLKALERRKGASVEEGSIIDVLEESPFSLCAIQGKP